MHSWILADRYCTDALLKLNHALLVIMVPAVSNTTLIQSHLITTNMLYCSQTPGICQTFKIFSISAVIHFSIVQILWLTSTPLTILTIFIFSQTCHSVHLKHSLLLFAALNAALSLSLTFSGAVTHLLLFSSVISPLSHTWALYYISLCSLVSLCRSVVLF